jgi:UDPglucose 6-dehydrogenase
MLEEVYATVMENSPPCRRMSIENAELTKIAVNTYVTTKITFANMLADLCERIPGGDVDVVTQALGSDARIGRRYLTGAIGYGGPCFPRDNVALAYIARKLGSRASLAEATDDMNRSLTESRAEQLLPLVRSGETVAVLGLAYKPHSHVIEESQGVALARALSEGGARVVAYDPLAGEEAARALPRVRIAGSIDECLADAGMVVVTTPDPEFRNLDVDKLVPEGRRITVVDFWRIFADRLEGRPGVDYVAAGRSRDDLENAERLLRLWGQSTAVEA